MTSRPTRFSLPRRPEAFALDSPRRGFTLVEILVALTLTMMLMTVVVRVFGGVGDGIRKSRAALEQFDRLRSAAMQLKTDLGNVTARPDGRPGRPEEAIGYLEVVEGSFNYAAGNPSYYGVNDSGAPDYTVGERGDMILFTARSPARPYVGRFGYSNNNVQTVQSDVAEICWFLRGNRLHRRVLLVMPGANLGNVNTSKAKFYNDCDVSAHLVKGQPVPNSLGDLTKRENRFGHNASQYPFDVRGWGGYCLPTLAECSSPTFLAGWQNGSTPAPQSGPMNSNVDMWDNTPSGTLNTTLSDQMLTNGANDGLRVADDVILNNVIEFDVKVWDPGFVPATGTQGGYCDLGQSSGQTVDIGSYAPPATATSPRFSNFGGVTVNGLGVNRIYDTGSFSYENEGTYNLDTSGNPQAITPGGRYTNGLDDNANGVVDDQTERISSIPYPVPLRGIQVKIRCFEPTSRQVREVSIESDFLPK